MTAREFVSGAGIVEFSTDEQIARGLIMDNLDTVTDYFETRPDECARHADVLIMRANVLRRDYAGAIESAKPLAAYFAANADADYSNNSGRAVANDEMADGMVLAAAVAQLQRLSEAGR